MILNYPWISAMGFRAGGRMFQFRPGQQGSESAYFVTPFANDKTFKPSQLRIIKSKMKLHFQNDTSMQLSLGNRFVVVRY